MAGIGFELRRLLQKESLSGKLQAYVFSAVIGSGPWVLSIVAILAIAVLSASGQGGSVFVSTFQVSLTYLMAFSLILSGLLQLMFTRFIADRLFDGHTDVVLPNLFGALLLTIAVSGSLALLAVTFWLGGSLFYRATMFMAFVILNAIWIVVIFASAIKAYKKVLLVFLIGYSVTVAMAYLLRSLGVEGLLMGFVIGQAVLLFSLLSMVITAYPSNGLLAFGFLQKTQIYPSLIATGLFYNLGVWIDKFIFWLHPDTGIHITTSLRASPLYDLPIFLSYLSLIPGMAVFLIRMEADFAEHCERFFSTIKNGGSLRELQQAKEALVESVQAGLMTVIKVQGAVTLILLVMAGDILPALGITDMDRRILNLHLIGVALQLLFMSVLNVFYYLDKRGDALKVCLIFLLSNATLTGLLMPLGQAYYGLGFTLAMALTAAVSLLMLTRRLKFLEYDTFMLQKLD